MTPETHPEAAERLADGWLASAAARVRGAGWATGAALQPGGGPLPPVVAP